MTIATYAELKTAIADTVARTDLTDTQLSIFIALAEASINRRIRHWQMETRDTLSVSSRFTALPTDWLETIRLHIPGEPSRMELIGLAALQDKREADDTTGTPRYYAHVADELEVYPEPDDTYSVEMVYYAKVPALSNTATSNWLLTLAPDVYLYGALIHTAPLLQEDARIQTWGSLYQSAVDSLNQSGNAARWSGTGLRMKIRARG